MPKRSTHSFKLSREGRVQIPSGLRQELRLEPGSELVGRVEDGCLILETRDNVLRRLQQRFSHIPDEVSLAQDLIQDRRREVEEQIDRNGQPPSSQGTPVAR